MPNYDLDRLLVGVPRKIADAVLKDLYRNIKQFYKDSEQGMTEGYKKLSQDAAPSVSIKNHHKQADPSGMLKVDSERVDKEFKAVAEGMSKGVYSGRVNLIKRQTLDEGDTRNQQAPVEGKVLLKLVTSGNDHENPEKKSSAQKHRELLANSMGQLGEGAYTGNLGVIMPISIRPRGKAKDPELGGPWRLWRAIEWGPAATNYNIIIAKDVLSYTPAADPLDNMTLVRLDSVTFNSKVLVFMSTNLDFWGSHIIPGMDNIAISSPERYIGGTAPITTSINKNLSEAVLDASMQAAIRRVIEGG
jgi:hypothetical protein